MRTISDIKTILTPIVPNIYENHITEKQVVNFPYIVLLEMSSENMFADNQTYQDIVPLNIILHQASRNNALETSIKTALKDNHIPYEYDTDWDKNNLLYATTFSINL